MKKIISFILALSVVVSVVLTADISALCAQATPISEFNYRVDKDKSEAVIARYNGNRTNVVVPSKIKGYPVTEMRSTFYNNNTVTSVVLPSTLKKLGYNTFGLTTKIKSITIPKNVTTIESEAIYCCYSLQNIYVDKGNKSFSSKSGVLYGSYSKLIAYPIGNKRTSYTVVNGTRGLFTSAFKGSKYLKQVSLPDSIVGKPGNYIGNHLFENCSALESVRLAKDMYYISGSMFRNCKKLKSVKIPSNVNHIYYNAFENCTSLSSVSISKSVRDIGYKSFAGCTSLKSIDIPNSVNSIEACAFQGCTRLKSVDIPKSVEYLQPCIFNDCTNLKYIRILNPDVFIDDKNYDDHVGYFYESLGDMPVIYGYEGSTAQAHVEHIDSDLKFVPVKEVANYSIVLSPSYYHYDGKVKTPDVAVKDENGKVVKSSNYKVTYSAGRKNVGKYNVKVTMLGKYVGEFKTTFTIKPKKVTVTRVNSIKGGIDIHWSKVSGVSGYQLQYSTSPEFTNSKYIKLDKSRTGKAVKGLAKGKCYYVRLRTYKTVTINGEKVNIYSNYSKTYKVKAGK